MSLTSKTRGRVSSRVQIQIKEVRDDVLVLPNHEYRMVLETSSINFELRSDAEQDVIIDTFQSVLNSLPCPVQILVRVREIDIDQYVKQIESTKEDEKEMVYQEQIGNYCEFVRSLVSGNKILTRKFYVVIPYHRDQEPQDFALIKEHLNLNRLIIMKGLEKLGMKTRQLNSLELLDLFYTFYNGDLAKIQNLKGETLKALLNTIHV